jgi:hypothetical protein
MAIEHQYCVNHPDRAAIGICVMTRKPICGECSTRYEGVNYSKEGLELLHKQRRAAAGRGLGLNVTLGIVAWVLAPLLFFLVYAAYLSTATVFMDMLRPGGQ